MTSSGPLRLADRSPAPDLARGAALLGIALANGPTLLWGRELGPGHRPADGDAADRAVDLVVALLVDNRSYPLFALLLGYGTWQLAARRKRDGQDAAPLVVRRGLALVLLGTLHAALLFSGDVLGLYGLLVLGLSFALRATDRTLLRVAAVAVLPLAALSTFDGFVTQPGPDPTSESGLATAATWLPSVADRLAVWTTSLVLTPLVGTGLLATMLLGIVLARRGVLDDPAAHRPLLRRLAVGGTAVSLVGGLPFALAVGGIAQVGPLPVLAAVHGVTGAAGGVGYAAVAGLLAARAPSALVATGRRSLSAYLAQSLLLVPLLSPWALGWGRTVDSVRLAALCFVVWLLTVVACALLDRAGRRGPAEVLLRRLVYGRQPTERQGRARSSAT